MDAHSGDLYVLRESIIWMYILGIVLCFKGGYYMDVQSGDSLMF